MSVINQNLLLTPEGYQISRSVRLRSSASAYFNRTPAAAGNRKTWTWSAWIKRGALGVRQGFFSCQNGAGNASLQFGFLDNDCFQMGNGNVYLLQSTALYRDPSAWYHCVVSVDTTLASNRSKVYINGTQITTWATNVFDSNVAQNTDLAINNNLVHYLGQIGANLSYFDGYLTEVNFIDGQALTASSFGETDAVTGVWKPKKYAGTYGTNGFYLNFSDNSAATATTIGKDYSGNGNNWTPNNISVTAGVTYDSMLDSPTPYADGGNGRGNYCTWNPLSGTSGTLSEGNLYFYGPASYASRMGTMGLPTSGKIYFESTIASAPFVPRAFNSGYNWVGVGLSTNFNVTSTPNGFNTNSLMVGENGYINNFASSVSDMGVTFANGDVIGFAIDTGANTYAIYKNGTSVASGTINVTAGSQLSPMHISYDASYGAQKINFGQRPFAYTPPTGFKALNTQNLPAATINNGAQYMAATLWTGNGASTVTVSNGANNPIGTTFQPDFVWSKQRNIAQSHELWDSVRGVGKSLESNATSAEYTATTYGQLTSFDSSGFTGSKGSDPTYSFLNASGGTYVGWQWKAGGTAVSNTSGSITSSVSANTTAGFSVVTATSNGANPFTVGHGLGVTPAMYIFKNRDAVDNWNVWHKSLASATDSYLLLNTTAAAATNAGQWGAGATSTTIGIRSSSLATNGQKIVLYCFAAVAGYSAFGSYTGNGSADGPFVYLGFKPRFILVKRIDSATYGNWEIIDTARDTYNQAYLDLSANLSAAENATDGAAWDILSNGFKCRDGSSTGNKNVSGATYIFAAFAENPFKNSLAR